MYRSDQFKMVLLGHTGVGKSSLSLRFAKGQYYDHAASTIGAAYFSHTIQIDPDTSLKIELWDTAGQERFHSLAPIYYRGAPAGLVVYDITDCESLRHAKTWVRELRQTNGSDMVIGIVGNKSDLAIGNRRQVDAEEVREYAEENGLTFMETSARRGDNVTEIFMNIAQQVAAKQQTTTLNKSHVAFPLKKPNTKQNSTCCNSKTE